MTVDGSSFSSIEDAAQPARHERDDGREPRFVAADARALRMVALDSLTAVYHRASGITHLVDAPVPQILAALTEPMTLAALLALLAAEYEVRDPDAAALRERLAELEAAGLVARA